MQIELLVRVPESRTGLTVVDAVRCFQNSASHEPLVTVLFHLLAYLPIMACLSYDTHIY